MFEFDMNLFMHILLAVVAVSLIPVVIYVACLFGYFITTVGIDVSKGIRNFSLKTAIPPTMPDFTTCPDCGLHIEVCTCHDNDLNYYRRTPPEYR